MRLRAAQAERDLKVVARLVCRFLSSAWIYGEKFMFWAWKNVAPARAQAGRLNALQHPCAG
jgi:hypothetical protein